jgi:hypothetical protein
MSKWRNVEFLIPRQSDRQIVDAVLTAFSEADVSLQSVNFDLAMGGPRIDCIGSDEVNNNPQLNNILIANSQLIRGFYFNFADDKILFLVEREATSLREKVTIHFTNLNQNPNLIAPEKAVNLVTYAKQQLKELTSQGQLDILGKEIREHYEIREANLSKLEATLAQILDQFVRNVAAQHQEREEEDRARRKELQTEFNERERTLREILAATETQLREADLTVQKEALNARLKEIDDRDSRYVRREIRADIKKELQKRYEKFELTQGTTNLRKPIFLFSIFLLALFGLGLILYSYESFRELTSDKAVSTGQLIAISIRQAAFAIAFGSTAVFFLRWNNKWFEQHAAEEFKLKRLELDLDRASWVVEMALEWKAEKGTEIPAELIDRLTANLFEEPQQETKPLHPADQLASALLGSSAEANINLAGGNSLKLDRKSMNDLKK